MLRSSDHGCAILWVASPTTTDDWQKRQVVRIGKNSLVGAPAPQHCRNGPQQYLDVLAERLIPDVLEVKLDPLAVFRDLAAPADLPMPGHSGFGGHEQDRGIAILNRLIRHDRTRAHKAHLANQHVE